MPRHGQQYADAGADYYEAQYRQRALRTAQRRAAQLGYSLVPLPDEPIQNPPAPQPMTIHA